MSNLREDPILEAYLTETTQLVEQLEEIILVCEEARGFSEDMIHEIFRIMHTIKGSSAMMHFTNIATLAHALEDLFSFMRNHPQQEFEWSTLSDLMLEGVDFTKLELCKIKNGDAPDGDESDLIRRVKRILESLERGELNPIPQAPLSRHYKAHFFFTEDCGMENVRAYQIVHQLKEMVEEYRHHPDNILDESAADVIRTHGFQLWLKTDKLYDEVYSLLSNTSYLRQLELFLTDSMAEQQAEEGSAAENEVCHDNKQTAEKQHPSRDKEAVPNTSRHQGKTINVNVHKLDELMDLVGELVIAEAMVTQNTDLIGLELEQFQKASRHLQKITKEIQDKVMEIRMVPLVMSFQRMQRVVRDMSKELGKDVQLKMVGEHTEVDKNIIEHISDPIMHLVRNAIDHGIETVEDRVAAGKPETGVLTLEAQNIGGEVLIIVRDDGRGLDKARILQKAREHGLIHKPEADMTDRDIYNLIFLPGFSTKEAITEYSGRGVGMDVVVQNIAAVGGTVSVDSTPGQGATFTIKIPLTLAIIDGMNVRVGESKYTIPTTSIDSSFRPNERDIITDPHGNEMIMVRGNVYPIIRLHERYRVETNITRIVDGILIMVEQDGHRTCVFVDELLGQQQVVVKALPAYIRSFHSIEGISGCTLLGDGEISLILDVQGLLNMK